MNFTVHASRPTGRLAPFWASQGFTPATLLMTDDMRQQLTYLGSIPRAGMRYARIHFLLELVDADFSSADLSATQPVYSFARLDAGLDLLVRNGQAPIFELMGNPNGQFDDFHDPAQLSRWRALIRDLLLHLLERYGPSELQHWYFESWNEPDIGWWPQWPHDTASFNNYYDACAAGLEDVEAAAGLRLTFGGAGTCRTLSRLFIDFVAHADSGANCLTGAPVRVDFISIHEKGVRAHKEDLNPRTREMLDREIQAVDYLRQHHPRLAALPLMNNECDPQVGWKDHHTWHARPYYAAWVVKSLALHQRMAEDLGLDYAILSNDNGFIGEWGNRTLLARFGATQWIEDGQRGHLMLKGYEQHEMHTPPFAMIKKPVFNALTLLSFLGEERLAVTSSPGASGSLPDDAELGALATRAADGSLAVLVYFSRDRIMSSGQQQVTLSLHDLPFSSARLVHYRIDEAHGDPYALWEAAGAPSDPDANLLAAMRARQELELLSEPLDVATPDGRCQLTFELPLHSVSLLLFLPGAVPADLAIRGLRVEPFSGLHEMGEWLLRWEPLTTRALRTYRLLRADTPGSVFTPQPLPDLLCGACLVTRPGAYRIQAVDQWGSHGPQSDSLVIDY